MRCMTLAHTLRKLGVTVQFICRELQGNLCDLISQQFTVHRLPLIGMESLKLSRDNPYNQWLGVQWYIDAFQTKGILKNNDIDVLIVDHYALDAVWESSLRDCVKTIMVIDDLANRKHNCDILLDQNLYDDMPIRYNDLLPKHCLQLLGPGYALLREEFVRSRDKVRIRGGEVQRLLIFFGGSDASDETSKALDAIKLLHDHDLTADVVVGNSNPNKKNLELACSEMQNVQYHCQINYMADLMNRADLAIGAGGTTTWERCAVGLPAIVVTVAENQVEVTTAVSRTGAIHYLGDCKQIAPQTLAEAINRILRNPDQLRKMSEACIELMGDSGNGGSSKLAKILMELSLG